MILAGRRINDGMGAHIARKTVQQMIHAGRNIKGARVNVLGLTFKENVPDIRNSKVIDIVRELNEFGVETFVHDPLASHEDALHEYGLRLCDWGTMPAAGRGLRAAPQGVLGAPPTRKLEKIVRRAGLLDVKAALGADSSQRKGPRGLRL